MCVIAGDALVSGTTIAILRVRGEQFLFYKNVMRPKKKDEPQPGLLLFLPVSEADTDVRFATISDDRAFAPLDAVFAPRDPYLRGSNLRFETEHASAGLIADWPDYASFSRELRRYGVPVMSRGLRWDHRPYEARRQDPRTDARRPLHRRPHQPSSALRP